MTTVHYKASRTLTSFLDSDDFVRCIVGPVGSGKSSGCVLEGLRRASQQAAGPDKVRRSRGVIIRNTYSQLRDTTRKTFEEWIPQALCKWHEQSFTCDVAFALPDGTKVECEVLFRALDRPEDVKKLLSLELTWAYVNEVREVPKHILDVLESRVGRYPSKAQGGASWFGVWMDTNPWWPGHWGAKLFSKGLPGYRLFRQPGGRSSAAENIGNLPQGYYERLSVGKDREYVKVYIDGQDASGAIGSIFGAWISTVRDAGRLCAFDHPTDGVFTAWDLGHSDATGIWFWRINHDRSVDVVDHYESLGQDLTHYFNIVDGKPYKYVQHWLPHDAKAKTLATQMSVLERCREHWGPTMVNIVPDIGLDDGIGAGRWLLEQPTRIHERCAVAGRLEYSGVDALEQYQWQWDEDNQVFSRTPLHNWASHTADAFRYLAVVYKHSEWVTRPKEEAPPKAYAVPAHESYNLDELIAARNAERRRMR